MLDRLPGLGDTPPACGCTVRGSAPVPTLDATDCPADGRLAEAPACRATAARLLAGREGQVLVVEGRGVGRRHEGRGPRLLRAAGETATRLDGRDDVLASRAPRDPLGAAREAAGRAGPAADIAADTGLVAAADGATDHAAVLDPLVGPAVAGSRVAPGAPPAGSLVETWPLPHGGCLRRYDRPEHPVDVLHLDPAGTGLSPTDHRVLAAAADALATGVADGEGDGPAVAVRTAGPEPDADPDRLAAVLRKHTRGFGVLEDLFAVPAVSDVLAPAPVAANDLRVRLDGATLRTNVRLTREGAAALGSRLRAASGRALSRASPTLDAGVTLGPADRRVRVAAVTDPVCDGPGFAVRAHDDEPWTLPALVAGDTLSPPVAALLSLAVERGVSVLVAGARGAGKTTLLGALTWALPSTTRLVTIEDTPELPVEALQAHDRDVQPLFVDRTDAVDAAAALRMALRLGEGALAVGEVRGEEAAVLYEAMRVGANASAVLGTIHGDGAAAVRGRVTDDLGVEPTAFAATDLVVTCVARETPDGRTHEIAEVEEVHGPEAGDAAPLFTGDADGTTATGRVERGESVLVDTLARPDETYADVLEALAARQELLATLVRDGRTDPAAVTAAHDRRRAAR